MWLDFLRHQCPPFPRLCRSLHHFLFRQREKHRKGKQEQQHQRHQLPRPWLLRLVSFKVVLTSDTVDTWNWSIFHNEWISGSCRISFVFFFVNGFLLGSVLWIDFEMDCWRQKMPLSSQSCRWLGHYVLLIVIEVIFTGPLYFIIIGKLVVESGNFSFVFWWIIVTTI